MRGVYSVIPTPFASHGGVDEASLEAVVDLYVEAGVDGVVTLGETSEASRLDEEERRRVLGVVVEAVDGRTKVIVGTSAPATRLCVKRSREAAEAGADGVMVCPPRMGKLDSGAVLEHFRAVGMSVQIPVVVQDFPPVSGITMEPGLLVEITGNVPGARTIKLEDPPTPQKTARIMEIAGDDPLDVLGGLGGVFLLEELAAGAAGTMTGFAFPEILVSVVGHFRAGNEDAAADLFYRYVPLMRFEFQQGIGIPLRKEVLRRRGVVSLSAARAPSPALHSSTLESMDRLWSWLQRTQDEGWL